MDPHKLAACEKAIGYAFENKGRLRGALTHSSAKTEANGSNERLEFLGDAILGMAVSEYLYQRYPDYTEGELTKIKSVVVSQRALARISSEIGLRDFLLVGRGIADRKGMPRSLLANVFEAIVAATYLDGGLQAARDLITRHLANEVEAVQKNKYEKNYKSLLQQFSQQHLGSTPVYQVVKEEGPDHVKMFHVMTVIEGEAHGSGWGKSKKQAEQRAARDALDILKANAPDSQTEAAGEPPRQPEEVDTQ